MEKTLISKKNLALRWGCAESTISNLIDRKAITPIKEAPGVSFSLRKIIEIEESGCDPLSAFERRKLESEINKKDAEIARLREFIKTFFVESFQIVGGDFDVEGGKKGIQIQI